MSSKFPWDVKCLACNKVCCSECLENCGSEGTERCQRLTKNDCTCCGHPVRRHIRVLHYDAVPRMY